MPDLPEKVGVYCLDVGQGDCTFILGPPDLAVLCDCADAGVALKFVRDHGVRRLQAVVVTHLDRDHIQGLLPFLRSFIRDGGVVENVYVDRDRPLVDVRARKIAATLLKGLLDWEDAGVLRLGAPDRDAEPKAIAAGSDWRIDLVLPTHGAKLKLDLADAPDANARSAVLRIVRGTAAVLVGGDATLPSWERLEPKSLRAAAIRVSHHGGDLEPRAGGWTTDALYRAVGAQHAVVSVGTLNAYGHPKAEHLDHLRESGSAIRCTQVTRVCDPTPNAFRTTALGSGAGVAYPYRHYRASGALVSRAEVPCAGSVVIMLDEHSAVTVEPSVSGWHRAFVDGLARPRCRPPAE